jgi:glucose-1-phosphate cytidylyltransferase
LQLSQRFRFPAIFCALAVLSCELISRPFANMGICDDGPYIRVAQNVAATGHIAYNGWSAAMLIWQLYLGAAFIKLFGFSFTTVRSSTLLVSLALAFFLQRTLVRAGITERNATIGTLALVLSPLYLLLWHILKLYSAHGINDFLICCGYKGYVIKEYFANYFLHTSDVTFDMSANTMTVHNSVAEPWRVTLVDTGENTGTGGRLKKVAKYVADDEAFCMTYGDGVADIDITASIAFHKAHGKSVTMTSIQPAARFGALGLDGASVFSFREKPSEEGGWINGGFFVLKPDIFADITHDSQMFEQEPINSLVAKDEVRAFFHRGFWQAMDTLRDRQQLEALWSSGKAPWKTW